MHFSHESAADIASVVCWVFPLPHKAFSCQTRLRELAEADRDGRLVVLPAKTVFELTWDAGPDCDLICPVSVDGEGCCSFCDKGELCIYERKCRQEHIEQIGKTVFLTREEAEAALEAKRDGSTSM